VDQAAEGEHNHHKAILHSNEVTLLSRASVLLELLHPHHKATMTDDSIHRTTTKHRIKVKRTIHCHNRSVSLINLT
jgi:hypothetical protein